LRHRGHGDARGARGDVLRGAHRGPLPGVGARTRLAARAAALVLGSAPLAAGAHGFGQRFDLPLPLWLWVSGAGATIVLTFAAMALFFSSTQLVPRGAGVRIVSVSPIVTRAIRTAAVLAFVLTVCAGFIGAQDPYRNLITTMVWVTWWVGFAFVCALVGDLWALASPLGIPFKGFLRYPKQLGGWPAVVLFFAFAWA